MVIASLLLIASFCLGLGVVKTLQVHLRSGEKIALAAIIGHLLAAWILFLAVWLFGYVVGLTGAVLIIGLGGAWGMVKKGPGTDEEPWIVKKHGYVVPAVFSLLVGLVVFLTYTRYLPAGKDGGVMSGGYTWGDLALHLTIASQTAQQAIFRWEFSIYPGSPLVYPFLPDFYVGILGRLGMSWQTAFFVVNGTLLTSYLMVLGQLVHRITRSYRAALTALALLIGSGSSIGMWIYLQGLRVGNAIPWKSYDYTNADQYDMHFANIVTSHLLPQRTYLVAIGVLVSIALLLWHNRNHPSLSLQLTVISLACLLPFVHVHLSLIALLMVGVEFTYQWIKNKRLPIPIWYVFLALAIAAAQLIWQFRGAYTNTFTQQQWWWLTPKNGSPIVFWLRQLGAFWLLLPMGLWLLRRERGIYILLMGLAAFLFLAANSYQFQPNFWDNMKFLSVAYTFGLIPVSYAFSRALKGWWTLSALPIFIVLVGSGSLALAREFQNQYVLSSPEDLQIAELVKKFTPTDAVLVTSSNHNHPASMLAGRTIIEGYPGWLWSYGINTTERDKEVRSMMAAAPEFENLFRKYHARYVLIHSYEKRGYNFNQSYYSQNANLLGEADGWQLYEVRFSPN